MPVQIQVDDELLEFPDDMSDDDIQSVLRKEFQFGEDPLMASAAALSPPKLEAPTTVAINTAATTAGGPQLRIPGDGSFGRQVMEGIREIPSAAGELTEDMLRYALSETGIDTRKSLAGITPQIVPTGARISDATGLPRALTVPASGAGRAVAGLGQFLTSPLGATEVGIAALPGIGLFQRAKFIKDMAEGAGQAGGRLSALVEGGAKTEDDAQAMAEESANVLLMLFGAGKLTSAQFSQLTGVRAPLGRVLESQRTRLSKDLAEQLKRDEPLPDMASPEGIRQLGIPQDSLTAEPFLQPGVPALADAALREAQTRVVAPGQEGVAANALRQAIEPTQLTQVEPTRLAERVEGGGEAPYGKVSYQRAAEAPTVQPKPVSAEVVPKVAEALAPEVVKFNEDFSSGKRLSTDEAVRVGLKTKSIADLDALLDSYQRRVAESADLIKEYATATPERQQAIMDRVGSVQMPREVIEAAVDIGGNSERAPGPKYGERPLPWHKRPEIREWIEKNDTKIWTKENLENIRNELKSPVTETAAPAPAAALTPKELTRLRESNQPIPAKALDDIGAPIPADYVLEGDFYVSKGGDLVSKLESLKFSEAGEGRLYSLPHPDAIKAIGKATWNSAVDAAIATVKSGKSIAEAIEAGIAYLKKNVKAFDEKQARANIEYVTKGETEAAKPASKPPVISSATIEVKDPITGEPAKLITEQAARAMERKVKIPAEADVKKLADQMNLFSKEIGDALETGGQFLAKDLRPDVAKGAPAERGTVTSKDINQYFVNKLSSIRKDMQATKQKIAQQADVESGVYFDLLQKRFEQAFRQVQELRRASHESLYFWNKIKAEYQAIAQAAGEMPEMKRQLPVLDQIWKDMREKKYPQAGKHFVDYLRMNLFTMGSWTLDFGTNLVATGTKLPAWAIMDMAAMATGRAPTRMFSAMRALSNNMKNWIPGKRFRLPEQIESELGMTAGGEFGGRGREVMVDFSEILKGRPELADKLRHIDKVIAAPVRMKRAVDSFFGRFGATAELYNRAYMEGKTRGMKGDELKTFVEDFMRNPPEGAVGRAVKTGKELKFNRDLTKWEEAYAGNILTKLVVEAFPRWTLQFIRWGGEMTGANPVFFKDLVTGKATPEQAVNYLTKAATGWGGLYAFNQLFYDDVDPNSMEYVKEDGNRVRLSGRTPAPELYFIVAMLRGDTENAKAALAHLSVPGAKLLSGEPAGLISPLVDTIRESIRGRYTMEQTVRELTKLVNDTIPGKSVLGLIRAIYDPTIREGIGSPIPGLASRLPQRPNPTTGEPLAPKTRIPGTKIELPNVGGTPFPGAERVLNDIEKALLNHGLGTSRPRRTSIIDLPAEDVPKETRREYEQLVGKNVQQIVGDVIRTEEFKTLPFDVRRDVLMELLEVSRTVAKGELAQKHGTSMRPVKSVPLNVQRLPEKLKK